MTTMTRLIAVWCAWLLALGLCDNSFEDITYGSTVKLEHLSSRYRLHSHSINWGSGSGQQSVTALEQPGT